LVLESGSNRDKPIFAANAVKSPVATPFNSRFAICLVDTARAALSQANQL